MSYEQQGNRYWFTSLADAKDFRHQAEENVGWAGKVTLRHIPTKGMWRVVVHKGHYSL